jgi:hypothetical protein
MKEIVFYKPCKDFDPLSTNNGFIKIPNKPGVYIWGYWIWIDGKKTFCPMNVGEAGKGSGNLRTRLIQHYSTYFENKDDGTSAFFEINKYMIQTNIDELYEQLDYYSKLKRDGEKRFSKIKDQKDGKLKRLIFYQDARFFESILGEDKHDKKNIGIYSLIDILKGKKIKGNQGQEQGELLNKFFERQEVHLKNFFCIYAILDQQTTLKDRRIIENTVNKALREELGIATIADKKKNCANELDIKLGVIKDDLVKIEKRNGVKYTNNNNYINNKGNYHRNLTINFKNNDK